MHGLSKLAKAMLSSIPKYTYPDNPRKREKQAKKDPSYFHISNHYFQKEDENGVVNTYRIGITYRKPKE